MQNIAIFIPSLKSGGAEKQAAILGKLMSQEHVVHFIVFCGEAVASERNIQILATSKVQLHLLKGSHLHKLIKLHNILKAYSIDIVFNYLTYCDTIGSIVEWGSGVKRIYNGIRNSRLPFFKFAAELVSHNIIATGSIFNCQSGYNHFTARGFSRKKSFIIYNCMLDLEKPLIRHNKTVKNIITIGRFTKQKDYQTAIATIATLLSTRNDFRFTIIGNGQLEPKIRSWIKSFGIEHITNVVTENQNIQKLLNDADIYLSTSIYEGTSNSIMEAMNKSLPVVATAVGDNMMLVEDKRSGFLHGIKDKKGMADSLSILLDNYEMRIMFGRKGNEILKDRYSESVFQNKYMDLTK